MRNKSTDISYCIVTTDTDVLTTETWLISGDAVKRAELKSDGCGLNDYPRPSGIGILFKTGIRCIVLSSGELSSF